MQNYKFTKTSKEENMFLSILANNLEDAKKVAYLINKEYEFDTIIDIVDINIVRDKA